MANPFFSAFLPLATQSAAHGAIGAGQGMIEGQQLFQQLAAQQIQNEQARMTMEQQRQLFPMQMQTQQAMLSQLPQLNKLELQGKQQDIASKRASQGLSEAQAKMYGSGMYPPGNIEEAMWRRLQADPNDPEALNFFNTKAKTKMGASAGAGNMPLDDDTLRVMAQESALDPNYHPSFSGIFGPMNKQRFETLRANPNAQLPPNPYQPPPSMPPSAKGQPMPKAGARAENIIQQQGQTKLMRQGVEEFGPKGKSGQAVKSFGVAISHLETLRNLAKALQTNDTQLINKWSNVFSQQTGQPAVTNFNTAKKIVADEVTKAIVGGATALGDREANEASFMSAASPEQLAGSIDTVLELMRGQLKGLRKSYESSTNRKDFDKFLSPEAKLQVVPPSAPKAMPVPSKQQGQSQDMAEARDVVRGKDRSYVDKLVKNPKLTADQKRIIEEAWLIEQGQR